LTLAERFSREGFLAPVPVLTARECGVVREHLRWASPQPADWAKGRAATDWLMAHLGASPRLLELLTPLLGDNIVLWGCSVVRRKPGKQHPWHVDIETSDPAARFVSAWIGLKNTSKQSGLELIAGSHRARTVQEIQHAHGMHRGDAATATVLDWARQENPEARLVEPQLTDGEAVLFDGRLWHASQNACGTTRMALLLQFASADSPVQMLASNDFEWPFRFVPAPRPATILVQGTATGDANRLVPAPARNSRERIPMLSSSIRSLSLPLTEREGGGWQPHFLFKGSTGIFDQMSCHAAVLSPGHCPHPPHVHADEEILIVLDGEPEILLADRPSAEGARVERVALGTFSYYPAGQHHTIRNPGSTPVTYLMFKWRVTDARQNAEPLGTTLFQYSIDDPPEKLGWVIRKIFQQPTGLLRRLQCHTSWLAPGAGYPPHVDAYDVALLLLEGRVETLGRVVEPMSVIYYPAGEKHGIKNVGDTPARYLVFEFHAPRRELRTRARRLAGSIMRRALNRGSRSLGLAPSLR
jgi:oxalate decarboxylase/phosphoglucose isomerase-like protein (cupin superfamily)